MAGRPDVNNRQPDTMQKSLPALILAALLLPAGIAHADRAQPKGLFAFLAPHAETARSGTGETKARAELKQAVRAAMENRPRGRIWCVPFARAISGVDLRGNAKTWWDQAKGRYTRSKEPRIGAVMAFAASGAMPKGHVAVVSKVLSDREVLVDQANWVPNRITLDTLVVDVSAKGDWSRVRVANGQGSLGRVNPVKGFIHE